MKSLFPKVTTSREEFILHIMLVSKTENVSEKESDVWIKRVRTCVSEGSYLWNMIFIERISAYLILHELGHHVAAHLRFLTQSSFWVKLHNLIDIIDLLLPRKDEKIR